MDSHGVALATALAVSGTMIVLALCRAKTFSLPAASAVLRRDSAPPWCPQRSCISSADDRKKAKNKRVQFASEVVEFYVSSRNEASAEEEEEVEDRQPAPRMPANRVALYKGLLRDREMQRIACCY
ncbi:uncharacterized protein LOC141815689 [Curcuma longa]|uniref:uncharacterized protein LOC141815689 n=1 Tax=Curcuma longa TaxID=136217 RepID=UPI003D9F66ED